MKTEHNNKYSCLQTCFTVFSAILAIAIPITIAITSDRTQESISERQTELIERESEMVSRRELVGLAIGILKERPPRDKDGKKALFGVGEQGLRTWALNVLNESATKDNQIVDTETSQNATLLITGATSLSYSGSGFGGGAGFDFGPGFGNDFGGSDYSYDFKDKPEE